MFILNIFLVATLASILSAQSLSTSNCGQRPFGSSSKIVNGVQSLPGDWSWSISMSANGRHFCGGVLINEQWVLSAGHCFQQLTSTFVQSLTIDVGLTDRLMKESWVKTIKVSKVIVHETFSLQTLANDIALIKLAAPITLDNKYYIPACVPDVDGLNFDAQNRTAWATGWGATYYGGPVTRYKLQGSMKVNTDAKCKQRYGQMINTNNQICAGDYGLNNGACQGDSGGPFVSQMEDGRWYVLGLTSWGYDCGIGTIFTKVTSYLPWIKNKIALN